MFQIVTNGSWTVCGEGADEGLSCANKYRRVEGKQPFESLPRSTPRMESKFLATFFLVLVGLHAATSDPSDDYPPGCGCPCDPDDGDDPCWRNCDDDGCSGLLATLGIDLGNTLGGLGDTLDNTVNGLGLGRKKRDLSLDDVVQVADILSRKKRATQRSPAGFEPNM